MANIAAVRESLTSFESSLSYYASNSNDKLLMTIKESSYMVDGIGGGVWEGAIILSNLVEAIVTPSHHVLELGCGAGLTGIVAGLQGAKVTLTDRTTDLAEENISLLQKHLETKNWQQQQQQQQQQQPERFPGIRSYELSWGANDIEKMILSERGRIDIIIGAEIACLRKQQNNLMETIDALSDPSTIVLLSFDDPPVQISSSILPTENISTSSSADNGGLGIISKYERELDEKMKAAGFHRAVVCTATVEWYKKPPVRPPITPIAAASSEIFDAVDISNNCADKTVTETVTVIEDNLNDTVQRKSYAVVRDVTQLYYNDLSTVSFPCKIRHDTSSSSSSSSNEENNDRNSSSLSSSSSPSSSSCTASHTHHITAYYRPSATAHCSECNQLHFTVLRNHHGIDGCCRHNTG